MDSAQVTLCECGWRRFCCIGSTSSISSLQLLTEKLLLGLFFFFFSPTSELGRRASRKSTTRWTQSCSCSTMYTSRIHRMFEELRLVTWIASSCHMTTLHKWGLISASPLWVVWIDLVACSLQTENIPVVRRPDRKGLLAYLNGDSSKYHVIGIWFLIWMFKKWTTSWSRFVLCRFNCLSVFSFFTCNLYFSQPRQQASTEVHL